MEDLKPVFYCGLMFEVRSCPAFIIGGIRGMKPLGPPFSTNDFFLMLQIPAAVMLFMFDDSRALGAESEHISGPLLGDTTADDGVPADEESVKIRHPAESMVPYILFAADLIGVCVLLRRLARTWPSQPPRQC